MPPEAPAPRNEQGDADESKRLWDDEDGERRGARLRLEPGPDKPEPQRRVPKEAQRELEGKKLWRFHHRPRCVMFRSGAV